MEGYVLHDKLKLETVNPERENPAQGRIERDLVSDNQSAGLVGSNE